MKVVLQRVSRASVTVDRRVVGQIERGLLVLVGFTGTDSEEQVSWMAEKIAGLRIFADEDGKMNRDVVEVGGEVLVVSQFTLYGDGRKGRRPSFVDAARPEIAISLYESFKQALSARGLQVQSGEFGAEMDVELVNHGPVTILLER
jgi:D-tyrosyl-tRNA(Tyr) deacylase